jgi:predicted nuclease with TOPRIM domain
MNKTRVDDMLIEMIGPKVKEIEEKFGNNQSLSQEDINTLLLKSQYNHINHLDDKLNEVTADVASLKGDFKDLEHKFDRLEDKFDKLEVSLDNKIEKALNRNLKQTFFAIGGFFILIKGFEYLDLLIK